MVQLIKKSKDWRRADLPEPILVAHQPEFLPWLSYISKATMGDVYFILDTVQFEKEKFLNHYIESAFQKFDHPTYSQNHGEFIPKMSFIDLLFNHGNNSVEILKKSNYEKE